MTYRSQKSALRALYTIATAQGGYFTTKQAAKAGYGKRHVDYHSKAGNFERVGHGLYRLPTVAASEHDDLIRISLWSRGRDDTPQAVISHESAFALHELSDLLPGKIHVTVPRSFRKHPPRSCILHRGAIVRGDALDWDGFKVTTPLRTLVDADASDTISMEQLRQAVIDALDRGLVRRSALATASKSSSRLAAILKRMR